MEQRIFGLLPVLDRDGFMVDGVVRSDLTGAQREGEGEGSIDASDCIPCGSVVSAAGIFVGQSIHARGFV